MSSASVVTKGKKKATKTKHKQHNQVSKIQHIGTIDEAPPFLIDNEFVLRGYRINYNDVQSVLRSLFEGHNELINVWTHLIGIIIFIGLIVYILGPLQWNQFIPTHDLTSSLIIDDAMNLDAGELNLNSEFLQLKSNDVKGLIDDDFYDHAMQYWLEEVEGDNKEYFSSDYEQHWHSLLKQEYPKQSIKEMFLLEKDPYVELLKNLKHYLMLLDMIEIDNIEPNIAVNTVTYLSYTISKRIRNQLESCIEIAPDAHELSLTPEERTISKMVTTYKILLSTLYQHFYNLMRRISSHYHLTIDVKEMLNPDDVHSGYTDFESKTNVTVVPLILHMLAAISGLSFSTVFHLFYCHCEKTASWLSRFDYGGITILIGGSTIPPYIYTFYCGRLWYFGLLYTIGIDSICLIAFIIGLIPAFDSPDYRNIRAILFVLVGLASGLPGLHILFFRDPFVSPPAHGFLWALGGAVYISGAFLYAFRFPEKFFPGRFCYIGQSHNIWHLFVLGGALIHFYASLCEYQMRAMFPCLA